MRFFDDSDIWDENGKIQIYIVFTGYFVIG